MPTRCVVTLCLSLMCVPAAVALPQESSATQSAQDAAYIKHFVDHFHITPEEMADPSYFDSLHLGVVMDGHMRRTREYANDRGILAWTFSSVMMGLNEMYRATGDLKYLEYNRRCIQAVLDVRDDVRGKKLWTGRTVPAWGSEKYSKSGRAVFPVHTAMITYPMFDFVGLVRGNEKYAAEYGDKMDDDFPDTVARKATEAIDCHDRQWKQGSQPDEGYYIFLEQETHKEGAVLAVNRLSAMGRALWTSWKVTGNKAHKEKALALAHYIKRRITPATDGAYYWPFYPPKNPVTQPADWEMGKAEDTSHGTLSASFMIMLGMEGVVFDEADMVRLAHTVTKGFGRLGNGVMTSYIDGSPRVIPLRIGAVAIWLPLARYEPEVARCISQYFYHYGKRPSAYDAALIVSHADLFVQALHTQATSQPVADDAD